MKPVGQKLCDELHGAIKKGNRPIIRNHSWGLIFGDQSDVGTINALEADIVALERPTQFIEVIFNQGPTFLNKLIGEPIRSWRFVIWQQFYYLINFICCKLIFQPVQIWLGLNERG